MQEIELNTYPLHNDVKALTLNNLACLHMRLKRPHVAYKLLKLASSLAPKDHQIFLNLATALS
jgi:Flp pilus assembly protein TadD